MTNQSRIALLTLFILSLMLRLNAQHVSLAEYPVSIGDIILTMPWAGGLNAPQVMSADFFESDEPQALIFDRIGNVAIPVEYLGGDNSLMYQQIDRASVSLPPFSGWVVARDFNQDGVQDYFTSSLDVSGVFGIAVYEGKMNGDEIAYELLTYDAKNYLVVPAGNGTTNVYVSWEDIPAIDDIDGDGDMDVVAFEPGGSFIAYYRNYSVENGLGLDTMIFETEDFCWGKIKESEFNEELFLSDNPNSCSDGQLNGDPVLNPRHSGSTVTVFDQDLDGDMDCLIGDITSKRLVFAKNGGTADAAWITDQDANWPSYDISVDNAFFNAAFVFDANQDGHQDILSGVNSRSFAEDRNVIWLYENIGETPDQQYTLVQKDFLTDQMLDFGSVSNGAFADVNGDGLIDIVVGAYISDLNLAERIPSLHLLLNVGTSENPAFELADSDYLGMSQFASIQIWEYYPAFGDIDSDGDEDLMVGEFNGKLFFWENTAGPGAPMVFPSSIYPFADIDVGSASAPDLYDVNGDGLTDLVVGERNANFGSSGTCGSLNYFQNQGSIGNPVFQADPKLSPNTDCMGNVILNDIPGLPVFAKPRFFESQGETKLLVGTDEGEIRIYTNIQDQIYGTFDIENMDYGEISQGFKTSADVADLDQDGMFDLLIGNTRGGIAIYRSDLESTTTSIRDQSGPRLFGIFPNPNRGQFEITGMDQPTEMSIFDMNGKIISRKLISSGEKVDLSMEPKGVYLVKFGDGQRTEVYKLILQ